MCQRNEVARRPYHETEIPDKESIRQSFSLRVRTMTTCQPPIRSLAVFILALALVTAGCGNVHTKSVTERTEETYVEYLAEDKSRIAPAVRHELNPTSGKLSLAFVKEIEGPVYRAEKYVEVEKTLSQKEPHLLGALVLDTILVGIPLLMLPFDEGVQETHFGKTTVLGVPRRRVVLDKKTAVDTGRVTTKTVPYAEAPFVLHFGEALFEGRANAEGKATVSLFELIAGAVYPERAAGEDLAIDIALGAATDRLPNSLEARARLVPPPVAPEGENLALHRLPVPLEANERSVLVQFARSEAERRARLENLKFFVWENGKIRGLFLTAAGPLGNQDNPNKHKFYTSLPPLAEMPNGEPSENRSKVYVALESEKRAFELVQELAKSAVKIAALKYAGDKPEAPSRLIQGKYESRAMFEARVGKIRAEYELALKKYAQRFRDFPRLWRNKIIEDSFYYVFQYPQIAETYYDPERQFFAVDVVSTSPRASGYKYRLTLDSQVPNDEAPEFDKLLKKAEPVIRFSFDKDQVSLGYAQVRVKDRTYTALAAGHDFATKKLAEIDLSDAIKAVEVATATPSIAVNYVENPEIARKQMELERLRQKRAAKSELARLEAEIARLRSETGPTFDDDLPALIEALPTAPTDPRAHLFAIGVNDYDEVPDVPFAERSAQAMAKVLQKRFGILAENTVVLADDQATGTRIKDRLSLLMNLLQPGDKVYLYYAGHGVPARDGKSLYMLPRDGTIRTYEEPDFNFAKLLTKLSTSPAARIIAFADTCFSGRANAEQLVFEGVAPIILTAKEDRYDAAKVTLFLAGREDQFANQYEKKGHRLFSYHLIRGLAEGRVEPEELHSYVAKRVSQYSRRLGITYTQQPLLQGNKKTRL